MKYDVAFTAGLAGKGSVHLNDIGILCEGAAIQGSSAFDSARGLSGFINDSLLQIRAVRTIPYSRIQEAKALRWLQKGFRIIYTLPDGKRAKVQFAIEKSDKTRIAEFSARLDQMRSSTRLLSGLD